MADPNFMLFTKRVRDQMPTVNAETGATQMSQAVSKLLVAPNVPFKPSGATARSALRTSSAAVQRGSNIVMNR